MRVWSGLAAVTGLLSAPVAAETYSCTLDPAQSVFVKDGSITGTPIHFGSGAADKPWTFELVTSPDHVEINWPASPIQLNGKGHILQTGPDAFATFLVAGGPCMFTEGNCGAIVHYSKQSDTSLSIAVEPIALTRIENDERVPLEVYLVGKCQVKGAQK